MVFVSVDHLHGDDLESTVFESSEDFANQIALDAIWLDHDKATFCGHFGL